MLVARIMYGQTLFFDYLGKESLPRESVGGKTLSLLVGELTEKHLEKLPYEGDDFFEPFRA